MNFPKLVFLYTAILLIVLIFVLWVFDFSDLGIPERIPGTNLQIYSIVTVLAMIIVLVIFGKHVIRVYEEIKVGILILLGFIVCMVAQATYQFFRQWWILRFENNNKTQDYLVSLAGLAIISAFISISVAMELRKANVFIRYGSMVIFGVLIYLMKDNFPKGTW
jgi:hypothetical protein